MPFRFLFGGKRATDATDRKEELETDEEEALSELLDVEEDVVFYEDELNEVYFMNPNFGSSNSMRAPSASPVPGLQLAQRQYTRRMSSRLREHKRIPSVDASEIDVDVMLAPSAFAFQNIPSGAGNSFCSRDDSEIATRTMMDHSRTPSQNGRRSSAMGSPFANALYLNDYAQDDSEVGSCTLDKSIRLRHMGSALSYRLELSGTPEYSVCGDEDVRSPVRRGHSRRHSDMSEGMGSFKERNRMVRLESLVGGVEKADSSVLEFGILNPDTLRALQDQPTPRLFRSNSAKNPFSSEALPDLGDKQLDRNKALADEIEASRVSSYPICFLSNIEEEDEDESELEYQGVAEEAGDKAPGDGGNRPESSLSSLSLPSHIGVVRSSFKVRVATPEEKADDGFVNPAFEAEMDSPMAAHTPVTKKAPVLRMKSKKKQKQKSRKSAVVEEELLPSSRKSKEKRDESLHLALMERYLVQSVVNKYLVE